jgi:hypothetical protein
LHDIFGVHPTPQALGEIPLGNDDKLRDVLAEKRFRGFGISGA